ncbi:acetamidase/formamidase family protein [Gracilibacillus salinarum]|uniref:Acetamidase/formamidase family protein n=1 Tax=Gracilibacillus salinarum TaxID=2932255 RepID=A0ABY4GRH6_9BACI|nr:acetamidase/formamidase family protein [Gracilibacillus salinarum]UOQ86570.1 acetamidase/formamidase family protein [Gracilibacillus salinarum]
MAIYYINPSKETLHGSFSKDFKPVLTINSGDTVRYATLDALWGLEPFKEQKRRVFEPKDPMVDQGHALCGPVAIKGAEPGMVLQVNINEIRPSSWGWSFAGGPTHVKKRLGLEEQQVYHLNWSLDVEQMLGRSQENHTISLSPFMGTMGMPPNKSGIHSTIPPRFCGGNIDCKELVAGSTIYLPIPVSGGLFSVGDGHAAQGDGEISSQAVECPMDLVDLTFTLCKDRTLTMPRAETPTGWITFGFHEDLEEACMIAIDGMLDLMEELYELERKEAYTLASIVMDLCITQIVNGVKGVHAVLPHEAIQK